MCTIVDITHELPAAKLLFSESIPSCIAWPLRCVGSQNRRFVWQVACATNKGPVPKYRPDSREDCGWTGESYCFVAGPGTRFSKGRGLDRRLQAWYNGIQLNIH